MLNPVSHFFRSCLPTRRDDGAAADVLKPVRRQTQQQEPVIENRSKKFFLGNFAPRAKKFKDWLNPKQSGSSKEPVGESFVPDGTTSRSSGDNSAPGSPGSLLSRGRGERAGSPVAPQTNTNTMSKDSSKGTFSALPKASGSGLNPLDSGSYNEQPRMLQAHSPFGRRPNMSSSTVAISSQSAAADTSGTASLGSISSSAASGESRITETFSRITDSRSTSTAGSLDSRFDDAVSLAHSNLPIPGNLSSPRDSLDLDSLSSQPDSVPSFTASIYPTDAETKKYEELKSKDAAELDPDERAFATPGRMATSHPSGIGPILAVPDSRSTRSDQPIALTSVGNEPETSGQGQEIRSTSDGNQEQVQASIQMQPDHLQTSASEQIRTAIAHLAVTIARINEEMPRIPLDGDVGSKSWKQAYEVMEQATLVNHTLTADLTGLQNRLHAMQEQTILPAPEVLGPELSTIRKHANEALDNAIKYHEDVVGALVTASEHPESAIWSGEAKHFDEFELNKWINTPSAADQSVTSLGASTSNDQRERPSTPGKAEQLASLSVYVTAGAEQEADEGGAPSTTENPHFPFPEPTSTTSLRTAIFPGGNPSLGASSSARAPHDREPEITPASTPSTKRKDSIASPQAATQALEQTPPGHLQEAALSEKIRSEIAYLGDCRSNIDAALEHIVDAMNARSQTLQVAIDIGEEAAKVTRLKMKLNAHLTGLQKRMQELEQVNHSPSRKVTREALATELSRLRGDLENTVKIAMEFHDRTQKMVSSYVSGTTTLLRGLEPTTPSTQTAPFFFQINKQLDIIESDVSDALKRLADNSPTAFKMQRLLANIDELRHGQPDVTIANQYEAHAQFREISNTAKSLLATFSAERKNRAQSLCESQLRNEFCRIAEKNFMEGMQEFDDYPRHLTANPANALQKLTALSEILQIISANQPRNEATSNLIAMNKQQLRGAVLQTFERANMLAKYKPVSETANPTIALLELREMEKLAQLSGQLKPPAYVAPVQSQSARRAAPASVQVSRGATDVTTNMDAGAMRRILAERSQKALPSVSQPATW